MLVPSTYVPSGIYLDMQAKGDVVRLPVAQDGPLDFATFFAEEHRELLRLLCFVTGNRADAADLMQDAFLNSGSDGTGSSGSLILARTCSGE
jgi:hypothetical protein